MLTADPEGVTELDVPGQQDINPVEDATGRWLNEAIYERLLDTAA